MQFETPGTQKRSQHVRSLSFGALLADEFAKLCRSNLSIYPDDGLPHSVWELSDTELASFDDFMRSAIGSTNEEGG